jgi:isoprenylcysteine carboxyl methyltransferase (ICMT) family protein YpbQ
MTDGPPEAKPSLPKSVTHFGLNSIATCLALGALFALRRHDFGLENDVLVLLAAAAIPVIVMDVLVLRVFRRPSTGLDWDKDFSPDAGRVTTKLVGLVATLAPIAIAYWAFSEYHGSFYDPFYGLLRRFWASLVIAAVAYTWVLDGLMVDPRDAYWQLGRVVLRHASDARSSDIANLYRGWLVKAFFLPLMLVWMHNETKNLVHFDLSTVSWSNLRIYDFLYSLIFGVDLLFATVGYGLSLKMIDAHIRTAEPTIFGWVVALFCYQPFYSLFERQYVHYDHTSFGSWLTHNETMRWAWAISILLLITIYSLATVAFGVRFSNLTHRGILTNGPFRFTKHPAYVSKNLSWWMISVPFVMVEHNPWMSVKHCIGLAIVNFMYFMRAKTEEWHLSRDPVYVQYALWMNEHGALRFLNRIPIFKYKPPKELRYATTGGEKTYTGTAD